ncbi:DUF1206 domain-containing protein [Aquimarina celericrescens]|uniref:DUF1206 domain-containing protein n=1 Tax=Aquimarina celericrescens TaxID=1964542 RepID=A0ABW5AVJ1_9FLAO|nr:DUF1206 domain-containing protein [Aquimarina celericrescens]
MNQNIKTVAYIGYTAKGVVYALTGILALMTAFDLGGQKAGKLQIIEFLENQAFGKIILALLGVGLACYAFWRFMQSLNDPEGIGNDAKGIVKRISFFISGAVYLALGMYAIIEIFQEQGRSGSKMPIEEQSGKYLLIAIGIGLAIKSVYQFIKAIKGDFLNKFNFGTISSSKKKSIIKNLGYLGLIARGIVVGIISYFLIRAGMDLSSSNTIKGTKEAFSFLEQSTSGPWLFALVSIGLLSYGIYMFAMAKYRSFDD